MSCTTLHITNGNSLTNYLNELCIDGDIITWQEMLCEGPTIEHIGTPEFFKLRQDFLNDYYNAEVNREEYEAELNKFNNTKGYSEIILWFEYDLFCHINLIAVVNLLLQKKNKLPIYLVCSGRVEGEKDLKGLSELTPEQLFNHYDNKVKLKDSDIELLKNIWGVYCGKDHNLLKPLIVKPSSLLYLSNCLKAHLRRFPNTNNGLNSLEYNILNIVNTNKIKSKHHLLGYTLNYQGYYGFGDIQIERLIEKLSIFFDVKKDIILLNRKGHEAMLGHHNFSSEINNNLVYGGVNRLQYQYNRTENRLVKTISYAH